MSIWKHFIKPVVIGIPISVTFIDLVGYVARVDGRSMQPLLNPGRSTDYVFLSSWTLRQSKILRGDVICFISPRNPAHKIIKRVIGVEGDSIQPTKSHAAVLVPPGHVWVEGDHAAYSLDSNQFGPIALGLVTAKATAIVWPPNRWQKIKPENAITLGDVDNDGNNELVIGNTNGTLFIYKERSCIQTIEKLGMITAIGVGDVLNCGSNALVVVSGDGQCHVFLCLSRQSEDKNVEVNPSTFRLERVHVQKIPANTKVLLIGDIDNDGHFELVLGLTDRVVRSYRWVQNFTGGKLVCLNKWECANQIGNITLNYDTSRQPSLLISQPGGTFMRIRCQTDYASNSDKMIVDYQPLASGNVRNFSISSEIIGNLTMKNIADPETNFEGGMPYAVATLDGTLMLVRDEEIIWSVQVDQQLFAMSKMDITGDGNDKLIVCSWEGHTYILDQNKHVVRFQTEEPVSGFCTGYYYLGGKESAEPCLIYATFSNKILIYYDVNFADITLRNLLQLIEEDPESNASKLFRKKTTGYNKPQIRKFIHWCFYGNHHLRS